MSALVLIYITYIQLYVIYLKTFSIPEFLREVLPARVYLDSPPLLQRDRVHVERRGTNWRSGAEHRSGTHSDSSQGDKKRNNSLIRKVPTEEDKKRNNSVIRKVISEEEKKRKNAVILQVPTEKDKKRENPVDCQQERHHAVCIRQVSYSLTDYHSTDLLA